MTEYDDGNGMVWRQIDPDDEGDTPDEWDEALHKMQADDAEGPD